MAEFQPVSSPQSTSTPQDDSARADWAGDYLETDFAPVEQLEQPWSREKCLENVIELFPSISHAFVEELYQNRSDAFFNEAICAAMVEDVMSTSKFPTQKEQLARETKEAQRLKDVEAAEQQREAIAGEEWTKNSQYRRLVQYFFREEFPEHSITDIKRAIEQEKSLGNAYALLADNTEVARTRPTKRRRHVEPVDYLTNFPLDLVDQVQLELMIARSERVLELETATVTDQPDSLLSENTLECACCFADVPISLTHHCDGVEPHHFCQDCIRRCVENEIGSRKCRPHCLDMSGCHSLFAEYQLRSALDEKTMGHLLRLRQQEDLKAAGIEGLEECPFCDYLDVCLTVNVDREFRCLNEDCLLVSCRLCHQETHVPLTCEKSAAEREKDRKIDARHTLEEAMTDALIRVCNKCKAKFVKTEGCNRMHCTTCGNEQCYVCSENVKSYNHFGSGPGGTKCPTYDNEGVEKRHQEDVRKAEAVARAKIQAEMPDMSVDDLNIKVSEEVQAAEDSQARRVAAPGAPHAALPPAQRLHFLQLAQEEQIRQLRAIQRLHLHATGGDAGPMVAPMMVDARATRDDYGRTMHTPHLRWPRERRARATSTMLDVYSQRPQGDLVENVPMGWKDGWAREMTNHFPQIPRGIVHPVNTSHLDSQPVAFRNLANPLPGLTRRFLGLPEQLIVDDTAQQASVNFNGDMFHRVQESRLHRHHGSDDIWQFDEELRLQDATHPAGTGISRETLFQESPFMLTPFTQNPFKEDPFKDKPSRDNPFDGSPMMDRTFGQTPGTVEKQHRRNTSPPAKSRERKSPHSRHRYPYAPPPVEMGMQASARGEMDNVRGGLGPSRLAEAYQLSRSRRAVSAVSNAIAGFDDIEIERVQPLYPTQHRRSGDVFDAKEYPVSKSRRAMPPPTKRPREERTATANDADSPNRYTTRPHREASASIMATASPRLGVLMAPPAPSVPRFGTATPMRPPVFGPTSAGSTATTMSRGTPSRNNVRGPSIGILGTRFDTAIGTRSSLTNPATASSTNPWSAAARSMGLTGLTEVVDLTGGSSDDSDGRVQITHR